LADTREIYDTFPYPKCRLELRDRADLEQLSRFRILSTGLQPADFAGRSVLDLACGSGEFTASIASWGTRRALGVDQSERAIGFAQELSGRWGIEGLQFRTGDITADLDVGAPYDFLFVMGALDILDDPYDGFARALRYLKPGGMVTIGVYSSYGRLPLRLRRVLLDRVAPTPEGKRRLFERVVLRRPLSHDELVEVMERYYHEEVHFSVDDILGWFDRSGVRFVGVNPPVSPSANVRLAARLVAGLGGVLGGPGTLEERLQTWLAENPAGESASSHPGRLLTQLGWVLTPLCTEFKISGRLEDRS